MVQVHVEQAKSTSLLGNVYVGKVKNIVKNINAAFVEIADGQMCYLALGEMPAPKFFVMPRKTRKYVLAMN